MDLQKIAKRNIQLTEILTDKNVSDREKNVFLPEFYTNNEKMAKFILSLELMGDIKE
jgi:hypothetical protein